MTNLFTYGSLMCSDIMFKVAGCKVDFTDATLTDFSRKRLRDKEYPGIVPWQGASVSGIIYYDLYKEAIKRLDIFEGELYKRQTVKVITDKHGTISAMTYVIKPQSRDLMTNKDWSFSHFLAVERKIFEENYLGFYEL